MSVRGLKGERKDRMSRARKTEGIGAIRENIILFTYLPPAPTSLLGVIHKLSSD
jgi:hypothetical protein